MLTNQEMVALLAAATSDDTDSYKSMQDLIKILASCVGIDEETGEVYLRVKDADDSNLSASLNSNLSMLGNPSTGLSMSNGLDLQENNLLDG